ncbi:MAG TPA: M90 family metallopeptidase [Arenimonas sp.]|nr:M90 family metallopeptidase [Arenimonas sp.]
MLNLFRRQRRGGLPQSLPRIPERLGWLAALEAERQQRLLQLAAVVLQEKTFTPVQGLQLDTAQREILATLLALPLLEFGREGLHGWSEVVLYPGAFRVQRQHHDEDTGVLSEWDDDLAGESWEYGPLILSWDDVLADLDDPRAGYCLVAHEMAHKLDALDGVMDGTPPLPAAWQRQWAQDFQREFDAFCARVDAGEETPIDDYAAEAPEEFFAVASEYHFSAPALLAEHLPRVAAHLQRFYGPSPLA